MADGGQNVRAARIDIISHLRSNRRRCWLTRCYGMSYGLMEDLNMRGKPARLGYCSTRAVRYLPGLYPLDTT